MVGNVYLFFPYLLIDTRMSSLIKDCVIIWDLFLTNLNFVLRKRKTYTSNVGCRSYKCWTWSQKTSRFYIEFHQAFHKSIVACLSLLKTGFDLFNAVPVSFCSIPWITSLAYRIAISRNPIFFSLLFTDFALLWYWSFCDITWFLYSIKDISICYAEHEFWYTKKVIALDGVNRLYCRIRFCIIDFKNTEIFPRFTVFELSWRSRYVRFDPFF